MDWKSKIYYLKKLYEQDAKNGYQSKYLIDIGYECPKWRQGELENIVKPYSWIPRSYLEFIKEFDSLGLAFIVFYGSEGVCGIPLGKEIEYWREEGLSEDYFPFGKYADGSIFVFHKNGGVYFINYYDYEFENPEKICDSFEEFMRDYVLGKKYNKFGARDELFESLGWV